MSQCCQSRDLVAQLGYFDFHAATWKALPGFRYF